MTDKITLTSAGSGYNLTVINENFTKIETALNDRVLYRDVQAGEVNSLLSDLDANGKRIYNLSAPIDLNEAARLQDVQDAVSGATSANLISADDGVSGSIFTTVQGFITKILSNTGSTIIGFIRSGVGAVATTVSDWMGWNDIRVFEFMTAAQIADVKARTAESNLAAAIDVTVPVMNAITEAWKSGRRCHMPAGAYKARITLPIYDGVNTYQGDSFELYGDGAGNGFLGGPPYIKGTTVIAPDSTGVTLRYQNLLAAGTTSANHLYIRGIRFEHDSANPVVQFDRFSDYEVFERCEIRQHGTGAGLRCLHAYGGTIRDVHSMNDDLVLANPAVRTGTAFDIQTAAGLSGGLLRIEKCTGRGFQNALSLGGASDGVSATLVSQFESSTVTFGILVNAGMTNTTIHKPYFESVQDTCIKDQGRSTKVIGGMFFEGYTTGIDSKFDNYGSSYIGNHFHLNTANCTAIAVQSKGDATGTKKFVRDNHIYFLGSGGTFANVVGISLQGANPQVEIGENSFRPSRVWVGGAGTIQISDSSTGVLSGSVTTSDTLNSYTLYSNVGLSLSYSGNSISQANVSAGVLTLPVESDIAVNATAAVNVNSIALGSGRDRIVVLNTVNANMTFVKGAQMKLSANFAPATGGTLTLLLRTAAGVTTAYELARTTF